MGKLSWLQLQSCGVCEGRTQNTGKGCDASQPLFTIMAKWQKHEIRNGELPKPRLGRTNLMQTQTKKPKRKTLGYLEA